LSRQLVAQVGVRARESENAAVYEQVDGWMHKLHFLSIFSSGLVDGWMDDFIHARTSTTTDPAGRRRRG